MTRIRVWALSIDTRELYVSAKTGTLDRLIHALKHNPCFLGIRPKDMVFVSVKAGKGTHEEGSQGTGL